MNRYLIYICILFTQTIFAQTFLFSTLKTNDIAYSSLTDKIYASLDEGNEQYGNSLAIINPASGIIESTLQFENEPTVMALSADEQYLYIAFKNHNVIKRYNVTNDIVDLDINLGTFTWTGEPLVKYVRDVEVNPADHNKIAVTLYYESETLSAITLGFEYYNNDELLFGYPEPFNDYAVQKIKFIDDHTIFGHSGNSIPSPLTVFNIESSNEISVVADYEDMPNPHPFGIDSDFIHLNNSLIFKNGKTVNLENNIPSLGNTFSAKGSLVYNNEDNLVCFASRYDQVVYMSSLGYFSTVKLNRFNTDFTSYDSLQIPGVGTPISIINCGEGCMAVNIKGEDSNENFTIIRDLPLADKLFNKGKIIVYPNPVNNILNLQGDLTVKQISLTDCSGKSIFVSFNDNKVDVSHLSNGLYIVKITDENDNIYTNKFVKN